MGKIPKYLEMCEGAFKDIGIIDSELFNIKIPNLWACPYYGKEKYCKLIAERKPKGSTKWFQVYRQDQLQDIYFDFISGQLDPNDEKISRAAFVVASMSELKMLILNWNRAYPPLESYEQLWLVLVMLCKYNKRWSDNKGKWVKHQKDWWEVSKEFLEEIEKKIDKIGGKNEN